MKNYYVTCSVEYTDLNDGEPYNDVEFCSLIIQANTRESAKRKGSKEAIKLFKEEFGDYIKNVHCVINECYETADDARVD